MWVVKIRGLHNVATQITVDHDSIALWGAGKTGGTRNFKGNLREIVSLPQTLQNCVLCFHIQSADSVVWTDNHPAVTRSVNESGD